MKYVNSLNLSESNACDIACKIFSFFILKVLHRKLDFECKFYFERITIFLMSQNTHWQTVIGILKNQNRNKQHEKRI